jgi:large subunit ribosomal protein L25
MADINSMSAEPRQAVGTGAARAARRAGLVPGVIYGTGQETVPVAIDAKTFMLEYGKGGFFSRLYELELAGEKMRVLPRDVQVHPISDSPLHVDFLRLTAESRINVEVAVQFVNDEESPGIKRGGVLNVVRHTVEFNCRADSIPEAIIVDLTGLDIGASVHISHIDLPDGVTPTITDRDFTVATIAAPTVVEEEEKPAAEGEEGLELEGEGEGAVAAEGEGAEAKEGGEEKPGGGD